MREPSGENAPSMFKPGRAEMDRGRPPPPAGVMYRSGLPARNEVNTSSPPEGDHDGRMFCDALVTACTPAPSQSMANTSRRRLPVSAEKAMREAKKLFSPV